MNTVASASENEVKKLKSPKCGKGVVIAFQFHDSDGKQAINIHCKDKDLACFSMNLDGKFAAPPWVATAGKTVET